jgi:hypothetical protein
MILEDDIAIVGAEGIALSDDLVEFDKTRRHQGETRHYGVCLYLKGCELDLI